MPEPTIGMVFNVVTRTQKDVKELKEEFKELNGTVRENTTDLAVLKDWRSSRAEPAVKEVVDLKVELAKYGAKAGGVGAVAILVVVILKSLGVF